MVAIKIFPYKSSMQHITWFYAETADPLKEKSMNLSRSAPENIVKEVYLLKLTYSYRFTECFARRCKC